MDNTLDHVFYTKGFEMKKKTRTKLCTYLLQEMTKNLKTPWPEGMSIEEEF